MQKSYVVNGTSCCGLRGELSSKHVLYRLDRPINRPLPVGKQWAHALGAGCTEYIAVSPELGMEDLRGSNLPDVLGLALGGEHTSTMRQAFWWLWLDDSVIYVKVRIASDIIECPLRKRNLSSRYSDGVVPAD